MSSVLPRALPAAFALHVLASLPRAAEAGPPLSCHPFETGSAALLPWGDSPGWNSLDRSYDVRRLTADTMRLLSADAPILARMENLRRATIYAARDRHVAGELLATVLGRALRAAAEGGRDPLAWFDAGYLIESYRQVDQALHPDGPSWLDRLGPAPPPPVKPEGLEGYPLVLKALDLAGSSPEMEFAAALMTQGSVSAEHRRRASSTAKAGSPLARNLSR